MSGINTDQAGTCQADACVCVSSVLHVHSCASFDRRWRDELHDPCSITSALLSTPKEVVSNKIITLQSIGGAALTRRYDPREHHVRINAISLTIVNRTFVENKFLYKSNDNLINSQVRILEWTLYTFLFAYVLYNLKFKFISIFYEVTIE